MRRAGILLLLLLFLTGCAAGGSHKEVPAISFPEAEGLRVAVASDLHFNPDDTQKGPEATAVQYNPELVDALLWDARQQGAAFLLLTGDLVNGGRYERHAALAARLRQAEREGLDVYVLPGNHDLAPVSQSEFAAFYAEFGYDEAESRDAASLSYCVIRDGLMLLLMDMGGYSVSAIDLSAPPEHEEAFLREETLRWAEEMLEKAEREGLRVLCAGHYNLLPELSAQPGSGYYIENGARFAALLRRCGVPLYLSGHMHLRAVYREEGLTELLTEFLLAYPTGYSVLDLDESGLRYSPRRIDMDGWAAQAGEKDPKLLHYAQWQQDTLWADAERNIAYMAARNPLSRREAKQAAAFFYAVMDAYWAGSLSEKRAELESLPGSEPFYRCAEGYAYDWWLRSLLETATPDLAGFRLAYPAAG